MGYGIYKGDYLRSRRGDPGLFGFLGNVAGGIARAAGSVLPGPLGAAARGLGGILPGGSRSSASAAPGGRVLTSYAPMTGANMPGGLIPTPGIGGVIQRMLPGGQTGYMVKKRRRMNVTNPKALRRAIRRQAGFVKLARRALKGTGYTIVSRGSRSRRTVNVRESGPGSVRVG